MTNVFMKNKGYTKTVMVHNKKSDMEEVKWNAEYDGNVANVDMEINNNNDKQKFNVELNNDEIEELLNIPAVDKEIHTRLIHDLDNFHRHKKTRKRHPHKKKKVRFSKSLKFFPSSKLLRDKTLKRKFNRHKKHSHKKHSHKKHSHKKHSHKKHSHKKHSK
jgi:hypothetical protein